MVLEELQERYGVYVAEMVSQTLTLEAFAEMEIEELIPYFDLQAERAYEEYFSRQKLLPPEEGPLTSQDEYLKVLRHRWQKAEEMAYLVLQAEKDRLAREGKAMEA